MTHFVSGLELWQWRNKAQAAAISAAKDSEGAISPQEVDWLLQEWVAIDRLALRLGSFKTQPEIEIKIPFRELEQLWQKRLELRVPIQYLVGSAPWRQFTLKVSPAVLIPRPETECLIDLAIAAASADPNLQTGCWADLGTGSGAIALGLAAALPQATIYAVDQSQAAIAIAQQNAQTWALADRIQFYQGSWLNPLAFAKGQLSGLVSNPPYIPSQMVLELQPEVCQHEPHLALDGGTDGLDCIRHLVASAPDYLRQDGVWMVEMMAGQAELVFELLQQQGSYDRIEVRRDLAGIERFALARIKNN